jgi:hypothetical protein
MELIIGCVYVAATLADRLGRRKTIVLDVPRAAMLAFPGPESPMIAVFFRPGRIDG